MDKKSKIFFSIFFLLILIVVVISFNKYYILKDYYVKTEVDCDPATEKCFIYECDPEYDGECPEDPAEGISYYKIIIKKAFAIPLCDYNDDACPPIICLPGEDCTEILCDETAKAEGETCSDPAKYLLERTQPVGSPDCGPADENCLGIEEVLIEEEMNLDSEAFQAEENDAVETNPDPNDNPAKKNEEEPARNIFQPAE